jgi:hypothetical protein
MRKLDALKLETGDSVLCENSNRISGFEAIVQRVTPRGGRASRARTVRTPGRRSGMVALHPDREEAIDLRSCAVDQRAEPGDVDKGRSGAADSWPSDLGFEAISPGRVRTRPPPIGWGVYRPPNLGLYRLCPVCPEGH